MFFFIVIFLNDPRTESIFSYSSNRNPFHFNNDLYYSNCLLNLDLTRLNRLVFGNDWITAVFDIECEFFAQLILEDEANYLLVSAVRKID